MINSESLNQKIVDLILSECGHKLEGNACTKVMNAPSLLRQLAHLVNEVENLASPRPELWKWLPYYHFNLPPVPDLVVPVLEALKPGQIPTQQQRNLQPRQEAPPPVATILIANARVGEAYLSPLAISLNNHQLVQIIDVVFPHPIGLHFNVKNQTIEGIPTESGDFDIIVRWSCSSCHNGETKILFVVNPDPKSLWKIVEPPVDAPYRKEHIDYQGIVAEHIHLSAASRRGRSHEHAGSFRDDDFYINHSDVSGWCVMLVADGAGSAVNAREGSRIAVKTAGDYLFSQLNGRRGAELKQHILSWRPDEQQETKEALLHHFKQATTLAINNIQNEAICAEQPVKSYATTLLAAVSLRAGDSLFAATFWLGDGAIAAYSPSGKVRVLGNPDSGEYAGQTRFLDKEIIADPTFSRRISIGKWNDVSHLLLMTDGVSDPLFETDNGLRCDDKWASLVNEISPLLVEPHEAPERLAEWLNFFSPGNHDDRTLVVLW